MLVFPHVSFWDNWRCFSSKLVSFYSHIKVRTWDLFKWRFDWKTIFSNDVFSVGIHCETLRITSDAVLEFLRRRYPAEKALFFQSFRVEIWPKKHHFHGIFRGGTCQNRWSPCHDWFPEFMGRNLAENAPFSRYFWAGTCQNGWSPWPCKFQAFFFTIKFPSFWFSQWRSEKTKNQSCK